MAQETFDKVIDTEIGGSPICEAVKQLAGTLFEAVKPEYENDIYTEELEGGDDLDSDAATDADRMRDKFGTSMSVVDAKDIVSMPKKERSGDEGIDSETMTKYTTDASDDSVDDIIETLLPYSKTTKVSREDGEQLIAEVTNMICAYFKGKEWYDGDIEDELNAEKCSYDDFITVKSYIDKHSMDDVYAKLLDVLKPRVFTVPVQIKQTKYKMKARLYRPSEQSYVDPDSHSDESTLTLNIPAIYIPWIIRSGHQDITHKQGVTLKKLADCLNAVYHNAASDNGRTHTSIKIGNNFRLYSSDTTYNDDVLNLVTNAYLHDLDNLIFGFMVPKLAQLIEPEVPDTDEDDDSMSLGNKTPEDAYSDFDEVRERSMYNESIGTKLPGDIYNPALIEAVDHISEALFEG